jgi:hypothetical protein
LIGAAVCATLLRTSRKPKPFKSRSIETEPDHLIITQRNYNADWPVFPPALILRSNQNDLFFLGDEFQQVIPREILRDRIADEISYLAFARLAIALRHFLTTAPLVISGIEAHASV